jgi:putative transposase
VENGARYRQDALVSDSGIIGSKEFVAGVFDGVKHLLDSKCERWFTPVGGVDGVYSMKRLGVG